MAPVSVTAVPPPVIPTKAKRPVPPGIQTNGVSSSRSSPSPSLSAKRPPSSAKGQPSTSTLPNGNSIIRPPNRVRREAPGQAVAGRGSRNSAGLRSASMAAEFVVAPTAERRDYVVKHHHILRKFAGNPPSLVVHLHPNHFRFDQQDSVFTYNSPMSIFLKHIRAKTVPHDLLEWFVEGGVPFYDGCLIVQIYDHKSVAESKDVARPVSSSANTTIAASIHKSNPYLTPSPYVPYPKDSLVAPDTNGADVDSKERTAEEIDRESMPAPSDLPEGPKSKAPPKPNIYTRVLHPTSESMQKDLAIKARTPRGSSDGRREGTVTHIPPPTPMTAVPPTPTVSSMPPPSKKQKRERMELDGSNIHAFEGAVLLATTAPLDLEPAKTKEEMIAKLEALEHPDHSHPPPKPKTRKRTVAEMAADEASAADHERYMLTFDEREPSKSAAQGGASGADGEVQANSSGFEPRFERFKVIADIKREHAERKEQEKLKQAENERRLAQQKLEQQQQQQQQQMLAAQQAREQRDRELLQQQQQQQREQERLRREAAQAAAREQQAQAQQQSQRNEAQRRAMQAQAQAQNAGQAPQAPLQAQQNNANRQAGHGHPAQGQNVSTPAQRFSQPAASSPIVRQNTPQNMASPLVGGVAMQPSGSGMGTSPPRPSSVVQSSGPMAMPMSVSMSAGRGSQQSHGTPRQPNATPNMQPVGTPVNRPQQMVQTPRMPQGSPHAGMTQITQQQAMLMGQGQGMAMNMNNPQLAAQHIAAQQRLQSQRMQAAAMQGNMNPQLAQQRMMLAQQIQQQQQQQQQLQQQLRNAQNNPQLMMQYGQMVNNMTQSQMQQAQLQNALQQRQMMAQGQNFNGMNMNQAQAAQAQAAAQAQMMALQQQQQAQQQQQQQHHMNQTQLPPAILQQVRAHGARLYNSAYPAVLTRYGGNAENIPPEELENLRQQCIQQAQQQVVAAIKRGQAGGAMQQHHQQQQQAAMQGMAGMGMPQNM